MQIANRIVRVERAGDLDKYLLAVCLDCTGWGHGILLLKTGEQHGIVEVEACQAFRGKLKIDRFVLCSDEINFGDTGNRHQSGPGLLDIVSQFSLRETI